MKKDVTITLPPKTNLTVIKKENMYIYYIYNDFLFYKISRPQPLYQNLDTNSRTVIFKDFIENPFNTLFLKKLDNFLFSWNHYFYEKIKFTGKGYRITFRKKKKNNYILFWIFARHNYVI